MPRLPQTRPSINLRALTLEDVISRRRKLLIDMAEGLRIELRAALVSEAMPAKAAEAIETAFQSSLEDKDKGGPLSYSPHVYARRLLPSPATQSPATQSPATVAMPSTALSSTALSSTALPSIGLTTQHSTRSLPTVLWMPRPFCHRL